MTIEFEEKALEDLYTLGYTNDHRYKRLTKDIIKRYIKVVNYLKAASRIEELFLINSLHYAKKEGDLKGTEAVWINDQYRLLFHSSPNDQGIIVNALLLEISKHYE
ncbi:MAG: type II toxin-antitoxin system RelE/ParE family toxin [Bacteroidales bacterium]|jgi:proteic killer suppression protein|nr:type II toxin-antitoxin system RelE/ParE family toxin [Bacteroidales bacterium]